MKILILKDDGTTIHRFTINPLFEEQDAQAADEIRELIETVWTTEDVNSSSHPFMGPKQYAEYRATQRRQGRVLRGPYPEDRT